MTRHFLPLAHLSPRDGNDISYVVWRRSVGQFQEKPAFFPEPKGPPLFKLKKTACHSFDQSAIEENEQKEVDEASIQSALPISFCC